MTGRAEGKLELKNSKVYLIAERERVNLKASVYVHLKGYALARVTHLDVEHELLDSIIPPKRGEFLSIHGIKNGIEIKVEKEITYKKKKYKVKAIEILHPFLNEVLKEKEKTRTWVGGKLGGIYVGFRREEVKKLEEIAWERFRMKPV